MAREIFKQNGIQLDYVEAFFTTFDYPRLNWLHLISKNQFTAASPILLNLGRAEPELDQAKFMLSMGKLCELVEHERTVGRAQAQAEAAGLSADIDADEEIQTYDENLELVDVQLKLRNDLLAIIRDVDVAGTIQVADVGSKNEEVLAKARAITERATTQLVAGGRTGLANLFKRLVGNLIAGRRLGVEETMDALTLQDNTSSVGNFTVAMHLIYQSKVCSHSSHPIHWYFIETLADFFKYKKNLTAERREMAYRTLWRRIYIHDDWNSLQDTRAYSDAQVTERLRSTALFAALRDLYTGSLSSVIDPEALSKVVYRPTEAMLITNGEDLMERYSRVEYFGVSGSTRFTKEDVTTFIRDLEGEREALDDYIGVLEDGGLWDEVARIEESERPESVYENLEEQDSEEEQDTPIERGNSLGIDVSMEG
jgi:nuclear pore complex protein Nup133